MWGFKSSRSQLSHMPTEDRKTLANSWPVLTCLLHYHEVKQGMSTQGRIWGWDRCLLPRQEALPHCCHLRLPCRPLSAMSNGKRRKGSGESPLLTAARVGAGRWPWQPVETFATGSKDTCGCLSRGDTFGLSQTFNSQPQGPSTGEEGGLESTSPHTQPVIFPVEEKIWTQKGDWKTIRQNTRKNSPKTKARGAFVVGLELWEKFRKWRWESELSKGS